jgi:hypothetical protein
MTVGASQLFISQTHNLISADQGQSPLPYKQEVAELTAKDQLHGKMKWILGRISGLFTWGTGGVDSGPGRRLRTEWKSGFFRP